MQELQQKLEHGPRQVKARQQILARKQTEIDAFKAELKQARMVADQKNLQLKTNESKIADLKAKLNQATSNREFDIIRSQIDADTMANSVLEDEILEVLEKVDQIQQKISKAEAEAAQVAADVRRVAQEVETAAPKLRRRPPRSRPACAKRKKSCRGGPLKCTGDWCKPTGRPPWRPSKTTPAPRATRFFPPIRSSSSTRGSSSFCRSCGRLLYRPEAG